MDSPAVKLGQREPQNDPGPMCTDPAGERVWCFKKRQALGSGLRAIIPSFSGPTMYVHT